MYANKENIKNDPGASCANGGKAFFQPKLTVNQPNDVYEQEADAMADKVMRMPAAVINKNTFFKPANSLIQRDDSPAKTLTGGLSVVKEQLDAKPGYTEWQDKQTDALKKELWDKQPDELKAGIIGFGLSSAGILGSVIAADPAFRADTRNLLDSKNLALPLSLIPHHDYFPLSSFKYKLPSAAKAPTTFDTEFEFKPYLDLIKQKWNFLPKTDLTVGVSTAHPAGGGLNFTGGFIKLKFGGGIINLQGFLNQTLPATPMLVSGTDPGESPMWLMRSLPGQADDQLPKGSGVFLTVDVMRVPQLWQKEQKKPDVQRKCGGGQEEENVSTMGNGNITVPGVSPAVEQTLHSAGQPMDKDTQDFMGQRFGYDFSGVQIHNDSQANQSSAEINAHAYTHNNHIVFAAGQYQPQTDTGKHLMAHELTHVIQQGAQKPAIQRRRALDATESAPCLAKAEQTIQTLEKNMGAGSNYGQQDYIKGSVKILREKMSAGKIKCYAFDGRVHGMDDYSGDEIRLDGVNLNWVEEGTLLHEGVHAYQASQHQATARQYDAALHSQRSIDGKNPADLKLLKWKAWTEYWAYRAKSDYYNPTRRQPMSEDEIHLSIMSNPDVLNPTNLARSFDSSFNPKTYSPTP